MIYRAYLPLLVSVAVKSFVSMLCGMKRLGLLGGMT